MSPIYKPTKSPEDWRETLADPLKHWKTGFSAKSMAHSWEESDGVSEEISKAIEAAFGNPPEPLIIIPEFKVPLKGGDSESQNDAFLLARIGNLTASIMIEGKVNEPFDKIIGEWFKNPSEGKKVDRQQDLFHSSHNIKWETITESIDHLNWRYGKTAVSIGPWDLKYGEHLGTKIAFTRIPRREDAL